jgi:hypothetical protein
MNFFKNLFGSKKKDFTEEEFISNYKLKSEAIEKVLGKMENMIGHAIIPFEVGGAVDMYYFSEHIEGTGFATMELLNPDGNGPKSNIIGTYELVAFTKEKYNNIEESETAFNKIERHICSLFTTIGNYSSKAVLNPKETCEVPTNEEENACLLFDAYKGFEVANRIHHLLLCMEIFRSEMDFARANGTDKLIELLKNANHYPYSDLNREKVV